MKSCWRFIGKFQTLQMPLVNFKIGKQYRSILFVVNEKQRQLAEKSREQLIQSNRFSRPIVTEIRQAKTFGQLKIIINNFIRSNLKDIKDQAFASASFIFSAT